MDRIIRVSSCHDCWCGELDDIEPRIHVCLKLPGVNMPSLDITEHFNNKTLPDECPLEEVAWIAPKFKNNDCDIEGYIHKERSESEK